MALTRAEKQRYRERHLGVKAGKERIQILRQRSGQGTQLGRHFKP